MHSIPVKLSTNSLELMLLEACHGYQYAKFSQHAMWPGFSVGGETHPECIEVDTDS